MLSIDFPKWKIGDVRELGAEGADCEVDIVCDGRDGLPEPLGVATFAGGHHNGRRYAEAAVECVNACAAWRPDDPAVVARALTDLVGSAVAVVDSDGSISNRGVAELREILRVFGESPTGNAGYGDECIVPLEDGRTVRSPAYPAACEYVRVCDSDGNEQVYWYYTELEEDARDVLGALMGAIRHDSSGASWAKCDDCGRSFLTTALLPVQNLDHRIDHNGIVPAGECPDCRALCYLVGEGGAK